MLKYSSFRSTIKYMITQIMIKKTFFSSSIRMSGKSIKFDDKKSKKELISKKNKDYSRYMKFMLTKYQFQKKNHMVQINQLNISLDIMMLLDHSKTS